MSATAVIGDCHGKNEALKVLAATLREHPENPTIVQLGDLSHVGHDTVERDLTIWELARDGLVDTVLWGNHDRATVDAHHLFGGYAPPLPGVKTIMNQMERDGRLVFAYDAHGWLVTHAGLHPDAATILGPDPGTNAAEIVERIHEQRGGPVVNAISRQRGGANMYGGILWRDISEELWDGVPQVFGHSASPAHLVRGEVDRWYDIDIGGRPSAVDPEANCLAAIILPSQEIVRVDMSLDGSMSRITRLPLSSREVLKCA